MASAMEMAIARLQAHHHVSTPQPVPLSLADPVDYPVIVEGLASTFDFDAARCAIAPYALSWPTDPLPPLLYRHDEKQPAGHIRELSFDDHGRVRISAYVDHHEAKRAPAFSIGFTVLEYEIVDAESPVGFHCRVKKGFVTECSLTPEPCNRHALVQSRVRALSGSLDDALAAAERARKILEALMSAWQSPPQPPPAREIPEIEAGPAYVIGKLPAAALLRKRTEFRNLVAKLPAGIEGDVRC